jgi:hypothetical protein
MRIGGPLPRSLVAELLEAAEDDGVCLDWDEASGLDDETIEGAASSKEPLFLTHNECNFGELDSLEATCQSIGLTYAKGFEGYGSEWSASVEFWQPGWEKVRSWLATSSDQDPVLSIQEIRQHQRAGTLDAELALMELVASFKIPLAIVEDAPWTEEDQAAAEPQGWNIFDAGEANATLCADNDSDAFKTDEEAWDFVLKAAGDGDELARRALLHMKAWNPKEFDAITDRLSVQDQEHIERFLPAPAAAPATVA